MAKVICKLPNASELINGVKFVSHKLGMISEEIEDEVAAQFTRIEGYVLAEVEKVTGGKKDAKQAAQSGKATPPETDPAAKTDGENPPADPAAVGADAGNK